MAEKTEIQDCDWCQYDYSELGDHFTGDEDDRGEYEQHLALKKLETYLRKPWCSLCL